MKPLGLLYLSLCFSLISISQPNHLINAIIGDQSFIETFGKLPPPTFDEVLRIQTHLSYVEQTLRQVNTDHLTRAQQTNRSGIIDHLHTYWTKGIFPANFDFPNERKACFIDRDGRLCAVGYLIEQTEGAKLAQEINDRHQYKYVLEMNDSVLVKWADEQGLTVEECAMIQPTYGFTPTDQTTYVPIKSSYGVASGFLGGVNGAITILNVLNRNTAASKTASRVGIFSGASQVVLGLTNIKKDRIDQGINQPSVRTSYKSQNNLSYINIAAGTTTIITSVVNLYLHKNSGDKRNAVNLYSYPGIKQEMNMGVSFTRIL